MIFETNRQQNGICINIKFVFETVPWYVTFNRMHFLMKLYILPSYAISQSEYTLLLFKPSGSYS